MSTFISKLRSALGVALVLGVLASLSACVVHKYEDETEHEHEHEHDD